MISFYYGLHRQKTCPSLKSRLTVLIPPSKSPCRGPRLISPFLVCTCTKVHLETASSTLISFANPQARMFYCTSDLSVSDTARLPFPTDNSSNYAISAPNETAFAERADQLCSQLLYIVPKPLQQSSLEGRVPTENGCVALQKV